MISRQLRQLYYHLLKYPMKANASIYRAWRSPKDGLVKAHLGPGRERYLDGWVNVDANIISSKPDVWANLLDGLPFRDNSVDVFYSHHVIEHLPDSFLAAHFAEMYRCLKVGGVIRVGGPNVDMAIQKFVEKDSEWFYDYPDKHASLGGRFVNFVMCRGEHLTMLTSSYLEELASTAGFTDITICRPVVETRYADLIDDAVLSKECEPTPDFPHTILIEAQKSSKAAAAPLRKAA